MAIVSGDPRSRGSTAPTAVHSETAGPCGPAVGGEGVRGQAWADASADEPASAGWPKTDANAARTMAIGLP